MKEIIEKLEEIVNKELEKNEVPNEDVRECIRVLISYHFENRLDLFLKTSKNNSQTENKENNVEVQA